jgi:hypothetical protein
MTKILTAMIAIIAIAGSLSAKGRTINPESKWMVGAHGYIGENIAGTYDLGLACGGELKIGYGISEHGIIYTGFAYMYKNFLRWENVGDDSHSVTYGQKYIDVVLAYRYKYKLVYFDAGMYYGKRIGRMRYKDDDGVVSGKVPDKYTHDDYGVLFGGGVMLPFGSRYAVELGSEFKFGLVNVYTEEEKVRNMTLGVSAGLVMFY